MERIKSAADASVVLCTFELLLAFIELPIRFILLPLIILKCLIHD